MLLTTLVYCPYCLTDVDGFFVTGAIKAVYPFFVCHGWTGLILATQHVNKFATGGGARVDACLLEAPPYFMIGISWEVRDASIWLIFLLLQ